MGHQRHFLLFCFFFQELGNRGLLNGMGFLFMHICIRCVLFMLFSFVMKTSCGCLSFCLFTFSNVSTYWTKSILLGLVVSHIISRFLFEAGYITSMDNIFKLFFLCLFYHVAINLLIWSTWPMFVYCLFIVCELWGGEGSRVFLIFVLWREA